MSWSFSAIGKPAAVARACRDQIEKGLKCAEPEETFRKSGLELAAMSAEAHQDNHAVQVNASGSMYSYDGKCISNNFNLEVRPISGFVE